jgi:hypothetical protein
MSLLIEERIVTRYSTDKCLFWCTIESSTGGILYGNGLKAFGEGHDFLLLATLCVLGYSHF